MVRRIDVAELLEEAFQEAEWKGDKEACGVWFTDDRGYVLNKILGIQIKHVERAPDVFYAFWQPVETQVQLTYPYMEMKATPKKHQLIHDSTAPAKLSRVFDFSEPLSGFKMAPQELCSFIISHIEGRRQRDRAVCVFEIKEDEGLFCTLQKSKRNAETIYGKIKLQVEYHKCKKIEQVVKLNAATLLACLALFDEKTTLDFYNAHDRMKIDGINKTGNEVEIVLAHMK